MKTNRLLVAAVLATAIGVPIAGFVGDINRAQPMTGVIDLDSPLLSQFDLEDKRGVEAVAAM
jgi:hypothetical protein